MSYAEAQELGSRILLQKNPVTYEDFMIIVVTYYLTEYDPKKRGLPAELGL